MAKHHLFVLDISHNKLTQAGIDALEKSVDFLISEGNEQALKSKAVSKEQSFFELVKKMTPGATH